MKGQSLKERLWNKIEKQHECSVWTGCRGRGGYGKIWINGKLQSVHRVIWELKNGPIPKGMEICHHCDNPACVEIRHLFLSTHCGNLKDAVQKGRIQHGENHGRAKLTERDIHEIRETEGTIQRIAKQFGVTHQMISRIKLHKNWTHV